MSAWTADILVRRAAFIMVELETMELARAEGGPFERSVHTQMVNCLQGLLFKLGIERHAEAAPSLRDYVAAGGKR